MGERTGRPDPESSPAAIELHDVWLDIGDIRVLEAVSLTVEPGGFLGVIGPNGAGKTTLLKVLLGLFEPDRGTVRIFGRPPRRARDEIAYVPQLSTFDADFPIRVRDVVLMGRLRRNRLLRRHTKADHERMREALRLLDIQGLADRQVGRLSGGQLQRVLIARALATEARLLLVDEPTAGLDPRIGEQFYALLGDLSRRLTIVLVAHDIGIMVRHVRSIACLNRRLHYHPSGELTREMVHEVYGYPVDIVLHDHVLGPDCS